MKKLSLKRKLTLVVLAMSLLSVAGSSFISHLASKALYGGKTNLVKFSAEGLIDKIDRNLFERYGDVQAFALSEPARSMDPKRIVAFIDDMMGTYAPVYDMMIVVDRNGKVIATNTIGKGGAAVASQFMIGKDYSQSPWFKSAMAGEIKPGSSYVEELHVDEDVSKAIANSGRVMNFTSPIRRPGSNEILGVWTNRVSWEDVIEGIVKEETTKIANENMPDVFTYIKNKDGLVLLDPGEKARNYSESLISASATSKGYSIYPGMGWQTIMQVPESDPQIVQKQWISFGALIILIAISVIGYFIVSGAVVVLTTVNERLNLEAKNVTSTSSTISQASKSLADSSTRQASALQETAASIEELNAMLKKNSENAEHSRSLANACNDVAGQGKSAVGNMIRAIDDIQTSNDEIMKQIEESNQRIADIIKVITEIGLKTKVINEIVFQTKLLSFNASVEAARAGEHGKGFAVVAEEVGNLAQMSGNAAKDISDMLNSSIQKVEAIVSETKEKVSVLVTRGKSKVEVGNRVAKECGDILDQIVGNIGKLGDMVSEISTATSEQAHGISEITKAMHELDEVTNENASTSQQTSSSSAHLDDRARELFSVVSSLKLIIHGHKNADQPSEVEKLAA